MVRDQVVPPPVPADCLIPWQQALRRAQSQHEVAETSEELRLYCNTGGKVQDTFLDLQMPALFLAQLLTQGQN